MTTLNKNDPYYPIKGPAHEYHYSGIPLRLEIAARILSALHASSSSDSSDSSLYTARVALNWADTLIDAHNETCETKD